MSYETQLSPDRLWRLSHRGRVEERPAQRVAVLSLFGGTCAEREREAVARLRAWIISEGLQSFGEPTIAYYDAPFIPGFLRRNEAMLRVAE